MRGSRNTIRISPRNTRCVSETGQGAEVAPVTAQDFVDGMRFVADHKKTKSDMSIIKSVIAGLGEYYDTLVDFDDPNLAASKKPEGPREKLEAQFDDTVGVKALDEYTVQYTLTAPVPVSYTHLCRIRSR